MFLTKYTKLFLFCFRQGAKVRCKNIDVAKTVRRKNIDVAKTVRRKNIDVAKTSTLQKRYVEKTVRRCKGTSQMKHYNIL